MRKYFLVLVMASCLFITACKKATPDIVENIPDCIRTEIITIINNPQLLISGVTEYRFQNKLVYAFAPDSTVIADGSTAIKDKNCTTLCNVGGYGGPQINLCNGDNFFQTAVLTRIIWRKY
ncbi:MAG: hypothetical protein ABL876_01905 [Chitinophagaceae bacterium]